MAFNFLKWILNKTTSKEGTEVSVGDFLDGETDSAMTGLEIYLQRMAFWSIVRKIGSAVAAVEWETYRRGKKVKAREYWAWNYSPNPNQNREQFFQHLIGQLYFRQEALVIETGAGHRYVADAFTVEKRLDGDIYRDVVVEGENVPGVYRSSDVLHFVIEGEQIHRILLAIAGAEGKLLKSATAGYVKSQGSRGILKIDDIAEGEADFEETYNDLINNKFRRYFTAENAVLPLYNGYEFTENEKKGGGTKASLTGTRDIRNMIDDIVELTAQTIGIPPSIATGKNVTDTDFKSFMTFLTQSIVRMLMEEINRKIYGRDLVFAGTYISPNYANVKYTDLFDVANPIDKLISSGAFCINDIRTRLGLDVIDEDWAWQHWMTKNYSTVEDLLDGVDGTTASVPEDEKGEEDEQEQTEPDDEG